VIAGDGPGEVRRLFAHAAEAVGGFHDPQLRHVRTVPGGALLVLDCMQPDGRRRVTLRLVRRADAWWIADATFSEVDFSEVAAFDAIEALDEARRPAVQAFRRASRLLAEERFEDVVKAVAAEKLATFPDALRANMTALRGYALVEAGEWADAAAAFDEALAVRPLAGAMLARAGVCNVLGEHDRALEFAQRAEERVGPHPSAAYERTVALRALDRRDDAVKAALTGLADEPQHTPLVIELVLALPDGRKDEVGKHLLRLDGVDEEVVDVAEACVDEEDWSAVAAIAEAYRGRRPDSPLSAFYGASPCGPRSDRR
jgi:tetratricopeptide (TPR) repeat protein